MNIGIIGAGWYGCHLGLVLKEKGHDVTIFERNGQIFSEASGNNQNRWHLGFHYPRSGKTRNQLMETRLPFLDRYNQFLVTVPNNIYAIAQESCIDFQTYYEILAGDIVNPSNFALENIEGAILCHEEQIGTDAVRNYFRDELAPNIEYDSTIHSINQYPTWANLEIHQRGCNFTRSYDLILNCTYGQFFPSNNSIMYEGCVLLVYEKLKDIPLGALTVVDGPFCSLYPYKNNLYTLSSVKHTPVSLSKHVQFAFSDLKLKTSWDVANVRTIRDNMEREITHFAPWFIHSFKYSHFLTSIKVKPANDTSANREFFGERNGHVLGVYSGKINNIMLAEQYVLGEINA